MGGLTTLILVGVLAYIVACFIWPESICAHCDGRGRTSQPGNKRAVRTCFWCKGVGRRTRLGRRLLSRRK
jgi:hypothetical protein